MFWRNLNMRNIVLPQMSSMIQQQTQSGNVAIYQQLKPQIDYITNRIIQANRFQEIFQLIFKDQHIVEMISQLIKNNKEILELKDHKDPQLIIEQHNSDEEMIS